MATKLKTLLNQYILRIREIKYKEKFIDEKDLYPGNYIKEIAQKILKKKSE